MEKLKNVLTEEECSEIAQLFKSSMNRTHVILSSMEPYATLLEKLPQGDRKGLEDLIASISDEDVITLLEAICVGLAEVLSGHIPELKSYVHMFTNEDGEPLDHDRPVH